MADNKTATNILVQNVMNISAEAAQKVLDDPESIPLEKRIKLGLDMMRAQDSRVRAVGNIKDINDRSQERVTRAMDSAAYG